MEPRNRADYEQTFSRIATILERLAEAAVEADNGIEKLATNNRQAERSH